MKNLLLLIAMTVLCAVSISAQKQTKPAAPKVETTAQAVERMEREVTADFLKGSTAAFEKYSLPNWIFTGPDGVMVTRRDMIESIKSGMLKFTESTMTDFKVTTFGTETAVVTYVSDDKGTAMGNDISGKSRWTDTWVKTGGKWMCAAVSGVGVMETKPK